MIEIFYQHNINPEDDNGLDFEDLLEKTLVLVRRKKYLADFIWDKEIHLANKYTKP